MPGISFTPIEDGDAINVASTQTQSLAVQATINDLQENSTRDGGLQAAHLASLVIDTGIENDNTNVDTLFISGSGTHVYSTMYTAFGADGTTGRVILGSGAGTYSANNRLVFDFTGAAGGGLTLGMSNASRIAGILVLLNVEFELYSLNGGEVIECMTCLQFKVAANWYTIPRTERFMDCRISGSFADLVPEQDIATRCLIVPTDLADAGLAAGSLVLGVRAMTACYLVSGASGAGTSITLGSCQMTVIPLHAEKP